MTAQLGVGFDFGPDGSLVVVALLDEGRVAKAGDFKVGDLWIRVAVGDVPAELARSVIEEGRSLDVAELTIEMLRDGKPLTLKIPAPNSASEVAQLVADEDADSLDETLLGEFRKYFATTVAPAVAAQEQEAAQPDAETVAAAESELPLDPPPRRPIDDTQTPFGPRPYPPNCPEHERAWFEFSSRQDAVSYSAIDGNYDPFALPDVGLPR